jgi:hypothetical protein
LQEEDEHLANMRQWLKKLTLEDSVATWGISKRSIPPS